MPRTAVSAANVTMNDCSLAVGRERPVDDANGEPDH